MRCFSTALHNSSLNHLLLLLFGLVEGPTWTSPPAISLFPAICEASTNTIRSLTCSLRSCMIQEEASGDGNVRHVLCARRPSDHTEQRPQVAILLPPPRPPAARSQSCSVRWGRSPAGSVKVAHVQSLWLISNLLVCNVQPH